MKNDFMNEALLQAKIAFEKDEVPVGAVLVENGKIIAKAFNQNITLKDSHRLENCDLYVTVEPCSMCAAAISWARIKRVYFGVADEKFGAIENGARLFSQTSNYHKPEIYSGFCADESKQLMQNFFRKKR